MFRRLLFIVFALVLLGVLLGAAVGAGLGALSGPGRFRAVGGTLLVLAVGAVVLRWAFRGAWWPVRGLINAIGRLADGDYRARVEPIGPPSLRGVGESFNRMAERLEREDERRRRLLADLGHELRTPLTVIRGGVEALLDGVHPPDREHLAPLLEEAVVMERLLEDLRTMSEAEAGRLELHREPTDLAELAAETVAAYRPAAEAAGVAVEVAAPADLPLAELDPVRIREVLANLVVNALRYMPDGGRLTVRLAATPDQVSVAVADTGAGIPPERLPHVFDRFVKSDDSAGSGLGLTIARDLVKAHSGAIRAVSEPGHGTVISFELPLV